MNKKYIPFIVAFLLSILLTVATVYFSNEDNNASMKVNNTSIIEQSIDGEISNNREVFYVYDKNELIGVLQDYSVLQALLDDTYENEYKEEYPGSKLGLGANVHIEQKVSNLNYADIDNKIIEYVKEHKLFSVEVNKITFSNGQVAYVKNSDDFIDARNEFALNFISQESLTLFDNNGKYPELSTYGTRDISFKYLETATISRALINKEQILNSKEECLNYLSYGYNPKVEEYVVKDFDTIAGIAWLNNVSIQHLINNNPVIKNENQLLEAGTVLNVTELQSPIKVEVIKENLKKEVVYPGPTQYIYDSTIVEGRTTVVQSEKNGSKNVKYEETYINGELTGATAISSVVTTQPQNAIIRVGTKVIPNLGSGNFRLPIDNATLTCGWGCYYGHQGADLQNMYNRYGPVYASDRGTVIENSHDYIGGYHVVIDHNNGYQTYYGHMSQPGFVQVGTTVTQGEVIGQIGMTGYATGPHVHFEVRYQGVRQNPCRYINCY